MARVLSVFLVVYFLAFGQSQAQVPSQPGKIESGGPSIASQPEKKGPDLIVDEKEVVIRGWHGAGGGYAGSVRLTAKTQEGLRFVFLSSDLIRQRDGMKVDRQNVTTDGDIQLALDTPKNIKIKVTGIEEPGTYKGQVEFRRQGATSGDTSDLTVIANAAQPLTPLAGTEQIKLHLTNGTWSNFFVPRAETIDSRELQFKNPFQLPVQLLAAEFVLNGDQTGYQLKPPTVQIQNNNRGNPQDGPVINLNLELMRNDIPPDKYTGSLLFKFEGAKEMVQLPVVELTMRYGPVRALILLVVGILIGWFMLFMKTEGLARGKITRSLDDLKARINLIDGIDQSILRPMLRNVEFLVRNKKIDDAAKELDKIEERLTFLMNVEEIVKEVQNPDSLFFEKIRAIRCAVKSGKDKEAQDLFKELDSIPSFREQPKAKMALMVFKEPTEVAAPTPAPSQPSLLNRTDKEMQSISPSLIKWAPYVYYVIALLLLTSLGFVALYLKNNTFGASPFADYLSLILWGLGADVASRNLERLLPAVK